MSNIITNIRGVTFDNDSESAYPSATCAANVSKGTTKREIINIEGIPESTFRKLNIDIMHGHVNALSYCTQMFNLPNPEELLELYKKNKK